MALKHYVGTFNGRISCCTSWIGGGHFYTDNERLQKRIERHNHFKRGLIREVNDTPEPEKPTDVGIEELPWNDLKALATEKGIATFGKKKVDLVAELKALEE